ncbi:MAG TPA: hypothetical protein VFV38_44580 [Ktedonobacteraceae bacterium]|nr:hypothetical protein [Ktedonobacteraceae bacterium]
MRGVQPILAYASTLALYDARVQFPPAILNALVRDHRLDDETASFLIGRIMEARGPLSSTDVEELQPLLVDPALNERGRKDILRWLSTQDVPFLVPLLCSCYQEFKQDEEMSAVLTFALAVQGEKSFFDKLLDLLQEKREQDLHVLLGRLDAFLLKQADSTLLTALCCQPRWNAGVRADLIDAIGRSGKRAFVPAFLETLKDRATPRQVHLALARALTLLAREEEVAYELLSLYQRERNTEVKDALYTALGRVCRRANITIVPEGAQGNRLRVLKRSHALL